MRANITYMKHLRYLLLLILIVSSAPWGAHAQVVVLDAELLQPAIISEDFIPLNKKVLFDATDSELIPDQTATYRWDFTDSTVAHFGEELVYEFSSIGTHRVTLTITQNEISVAVDKEIFVYDSKILMITDQVALDNFQLIVEQAANNGVLLNIVSAVEEETEFLAEETLVPLIAEETEFISEADALIFYTRASIGMQAFTRFWQNLSIDNTITLANKLVVKITDENMGIAADLAQQSFIVTQPQFILLTRKEALNPIFETDNYTQLTATLEGRAIEYRIVDSRSEKSPFFFLSHTITDFITKGVPANTIYLLLAVPFIAFIITFARQVIGMVAFGIYTPLVITLGFMILGINFGIGTLVIIVLTSYVLRKLLGRFKLLYIPRTSLILSAIGLSFLGVIWFLSYYSASLATSLAIFPMLVMSTLSEKFLSAQSEEGVRGALMGVLQTIAVSIAAYYLVVWAAFNNLLMSWPELIIAPLLGMILLGKFTGLRLTEYARFRSLFKEKNIEE